MTRRSKLLERLKNNPVGVTFDQLEKVLVGEGFVLDRVSGSHHIFKRDAITFVIPTHKNQVKAVYVRRAIELLEEEV